MPGSTHTPLTDQQDQIHETKIGWIIHKEDLEIFTKDTPYMKSNNTLSGISDINYINQPEIFELIEKYKIIFCQNFDKFGNSEIAPSNNTKCITLVNLLQAPNTAILHVQFSKTGDYNSNIRSLERFGRTYVLYENLKRLK